MVCDWAPAWPHFLAVSGRVWRAFPTFDAKLTLTPPDAALCRSARGRKDVTLVGVQACDALAHWGLRRPVRDVPRLDTGPDPNMMALAVCTGAVASQRLRRTDGE
jgi:hypothetical protein